MVPIKILTPAFLFDFYTHRFGTINYFLLQNTDELSDSVLVTVKRSCFGFLPSKLIFDVNEYQLGQPEKPPRSTDLNHFV